jgi:outer membrane protein OmpA-like peptidoglycan-associated protein
VSSARAQEAGTIEAGIALRALWPDRQFDLPAALDPASPLAGPSGLARVGVGPVGRVGVFFANHWSFEGGWHRADQPALRAADVTARLVWHAPIGGQRVQMLTGAGAVVSLYRVAGYLGRSVREPASAPPTSYSGSTGGPDVGVSGLLGFRWLPRRTFAVRLDATLHVVRDPSARRGVEPPRPDILPALEIGASWFFNRPRASHSMRAQPPVSRPTPPRAAAPAPADSVVAPPTRATPPPVVPPPALDTAPVVPPPVTPDSAPPAAVLPAAGAAPLVLVGVSFASGTAVLTPASRQALDAVAASLVANPDVRIEVTGHTDATGDGRVNEILSLARAEAVRGYLSERGVALDRMTVAGFGGRRPIDTNATAAGRARNRRVELRRLP